MVRYFKRVAHLSPASAWTLLSEPWRIPVLAGAPPQSAPLDAVAALFPDTPSETHSALLLDLLRNGAFFAELHEAMVEKRRRRINFMEWYDFLYVAMRLLRPEVMVETGVFDGLSSAVILQAFADNDKGTLVSIDYPAVAGIEGSTHRMSESALPPGCTSGWLIPDRLRGRHRLLLGDSKVLLPAVLKEHPEIDVFFHDSMHTFEHQYFEYTAAWPHIRSRGLLLSDDIFWNAAFHKFSKEKGARYVHVEGFGAVRK